MNLSSVANRFNNTVCADAYTGVFAFMAQLGLYDDNKRDSETHERRVLSVDPRVAIPTRRVISAVGTHFIVGHGSPDDYKGKVIRVGHVIHEATYLARIRTLAQLCLGQTGVSAYAGRAWVKDAAFSQQSSTLAPEVHLHFSQTEVLEAALTVEFEGRLHIVRSLNAGPSGTTVSVCEEMKGSSVESGVLLTLSAYNPVIESPSASTVVVNAVRLRWQSLFEYHDTSAPKFGPGDLQIAIAKSAATVTPGSTLGLSDGRWRVESVVGEGLVWLCRATRYG